MVATANRKCTTVIFKRDAVTISATTKTTTKNATGTVVIAVQTARVYLISLFTATNANAVIPRAKRAHVLVLRTNTRGTRFVTTLTTTSLATGMVATAAKKDKCTSKQNTARSADAWTPHTRVLIVSANALVMDSAMMRTTISFAPTTVATAARTYRMVSSGTALSASASIPYSTLQAKTARARAAQLHTRKTASAMTIITTAAVAGTAVTAVHYLAIRSNFNIAADAAV